MGVPLDDLPDPAERWSEHATPGQSFGFIRASIWRCTKRIARRPGLSRNHYIVVNLDCILHGAEATAAYLERNPWHASLCQDAPFLNGFFTGLTGEKWTDVAPCAAFVAKETVVAHYEKYWDEYTRKEVQIELVEGLGQLAHPRVVAMLFRMTGGSRVKSAAKQWFVDHPERGAAHVQSMLDTQWKAMAEKLAKAMKL